ncbi:hypothetical protein ScalyP_jg11435 [Parmales sp. scaly parma]|nr:hypothetical protein ScalyP_jg11435 [Parmales sp. scaly parma]
MAQQQPQQKQSVGTGLFLNGERETGADVRNGNVTACMAIANICKTSLGPVGLDKMLVDDIGDVTITNDGATILKQLSVDHPAGKVLVELAELQDQEVGDGTTSVVIIASELLRRANELVKKGIHPTTIISGYRMALKQAVKHIKNNLIVTADTLGEVNLINSAKTSMSSKILGPESEFFARMAVDAVKSVKMPAVINDKKTFKYPISAIHILKAHGKSAMESHIVNGFALNCTRAAQGMPTTIKGAKIALLDINLQRHRMAMGVQVIVKDPKEIEAIRQREMDITKERIMKIIESGANIILTTKGIDDLCLKYFVEAGCIAARRCNKEDLKRLAKATGGKLVVTMADMEGNESFDAANLGTAGSVKEERVGDGELLYVRDCKGGASTIVLRGANEYMLDEMDRALHDSLCCVKRMLESNTLVAGGGAVEASLSVCLEDYAVTVDTREQLAIAEFAEAVLVIPKVLSVNAAKDATDLVAKLKSSHARAQGKFGGDSGNENLKYTGLDLIGGIIRDNLHAGVVEPAISKIKSLRFATEAAITILRIDDRITLTPDQQPGQ